MPIQIDLPIYLVALLAAILTELAKYIPWVRDNDIVKSLVAIVLVVIGAFITSGMQLTWAYFLSAMAFAFLNYKIIVQPIASGLSMKTQLKA